MAVTHYEPLLSQRCSMSKVNIKHPKPRLMARRVLEAVTAPIYQEQIYDPTRNCTVKKHEKIAELNPSKVDNENLYERFLIREARKIFQNNKMILALQPEYMEMRKKMEICNRFISAGLEPIVFYPDDILRKTIAETRWAGFGVLIHKRGMYIASKEPNVEAFMKVTKKMPEINLLGGLVEDQLLTKEALVRYSQLPDIDGLRRELVAILASSFGTTRSLLEAHQKNLIRNLRQYVHQNDMHSATSNVEERGQ